MGAICGLGSEALIDDAELVAGAGVRAGAVSTLVLPEMMKPLPSSTAPAPLTRLARMSVSTYVRSSRHTTRNDPLALTRGSS